MSTVLRVLFVVQLPPPVHGSSTISKILVESDIINSSFEVKVIPLNFAKDMTDIGSFSFTKLYKMVSYAVRLVTTMISFRPSLVYFSFSLMGLSFYRDVLYVMILKLFPAKIVYHLHVKGIHEESKRSRVKKVLYQWVFKNAYVITLSSRIAYDLSDVYSGKPYIVNNGITSIINESEQLSKPSLREKITLLYLSNLMRAKGIFVLLDALALLKNNSYKFLARIVGMPSDVTKKQLDSFIRENNLADSVTVEDPKYGNDKYEAFKNADIFIHPTLNDAFPLVILEAMQFQLPVISTAEGAIPEMVDDGITGILVPKEDPTALMNKIAYLLTEHEVRDKMAKAGRAKFLAHYTAKRMEHDLKDVLLKISSL